MTRIPSGTRIFADLDKKSARIRAAKHPRHPRANLLDLDFADIGKLLTNGKNLGGLANRIYFGLWADVATWPTEPTNPLMVDLLGTLTGDLLMKAGKRMFELYTTEDAAKLDASGTGSTSDGRRGLGMTFAYRSANRYTYTGSIPLTEAAPGS